MLKKINKENKLNIIELGFILNINIEITEEINKKIKNMKKFIGFL